MTNREWLNSLSDKEFAENLIDEWGISWQECIAWLKQEHKKPIKLSDVERVILENINPAYGWIARNKIPNALSFHESKPTKSENHWDSTEFGKMNFFECYNHLFQFIQWEDEKPYNIEELLKESK